MKECFPIPTVDEVLNEIHHAQLFSKTHLCACYNQIYINTSDTYKTTFRMVDDNYEFLTMSLCSCVFDIIHIYIMLHETYYEHLCYVFDALMQNWYFSKLLKCTLMVMEIHYTGHVNLQEWCHHGSKMFSQRIVQFPPSLLVFMVSSALQAITCIELYTHHLPT